jgi:pyruvate/2-oxoglutarate/acetoin dehydrogenase E1 component
MKKWSGMNLSLYDGPYRVTEGLCKKCGENQILDTAITKMGFGGLTVEAAMGGL